MRFSATVLGLAGLAGAILMLTGGDLPGGGSADRQPPAQAGQDRSARAEAPEQAGQVSAPADAPPRAALPDAPLPDTIRNVTPADILPPPPVQGPLKRVEARLPDLPKVEVPDDLTFRRPLVIDAATLRHKTLTIRLAGLDGPALAETCPSRLGGTWPCGRRARTALRAYVRRRAVTCDAVTEISPGLISAHCRRQDTDLSDWMVSQGWARPADDAPQALRDAGETARATRKGIWQLDWRGALDRPGLTADDDPAASGAETGTQPAPEAGGAVLEGLLGDVEIVDTPWHPQSAEMPDPQDPLPATGDRLPD
jgi:endonuclease YncB( thermonuclease family)